MTKEHLKAHCLQLSTLESEDVDRIRFASRTWSFQFLLDAADLAPAEQWL